MKVLVVIVAVACCACLAAEEEKKEAAAEGERPKTFKRLIPADVLRGEFFWDWRSLEDYGGFWNVLGRF